MFTTPLDEDLRTCICEPYSTTPHAGRSLPQPARAQTAAGQYDEGLSDDGSYGDQEFSTTKKAAPKRKKSSTTKPKRESSSHLARGQAGGCVRCPLPCRIRHRPTRLIPASRAATPRPSASDSDSEYGSRPRKKRKSKATENDYRISSRGGKVPNYKDEAEDFGFEDEAEYDNSYYAQPALGAPVGSEEEQHEIEVVISHHRDDDRKEDAEDVWNENIVSGHPAYMHLVR